MLKENTIMILFLLKINYFDELICAAFLRLLRPVSTLRPGSRPRAAGETGLSKFLPLGDTCLLPVGRLCRVPVSPWKHLFFMYFACLFVSYKRQNGWTDRAQFFWGTSCDPKEGLWMIELSKFATNIWLNFFENQRIFCY